MRDRGDLGLAPERRAGAPLGMRPCRRESERVCTGAASRSGVASIGQARWNLLRPARARKTVTTPCSRLTQGGGDAAIGPNRPVPRKRRKYIGLLQVRRLLCCGRCNAEQGPRLRGCDRGTGHERVVTGLVRVCAVRSPEGAPLPRSDTPCKGTYLSCGATSCSHPHLTQRAL